MCFSERLSAWNRILPASVRYGDPNLPARLPLENSITRHHPKQDVKYDQYRADKKHYLKNAGSSFRFCLLTNSDCLINGSNAAFVPESSQMCRGTEK